MILTFLVGSVAFAILPFSPVAFFILLGQDNSASDSDISQIRIFGILLLVIGGMIGVAVAYIKSNVLHSAIIGASISFAFCVITYVFNSSDFNGLGVLILALYVINGIATGLISKAFARFIS